MIIAVDAMGGDNAPEEIVKGALKAQRAVRGKILLVGDKTRIERLLPPKFARRQIEVVHCTDHIRMDESPGPGLRKRGDASLVVAARLVQNGEAQALVSAGNTGALYQVSLFQVGRLKGIRRPALAAMLPTEGSSALALDLGANAECKPEYFLQFAQMGNAYANGVLQIERPRIGLLNIGTELGKGNSLVTKAYHLLEHGGLNFVGSVEPTGFFQGEADVVVCDGFVGNMMLKTAEAVSEFILKRMKQAVTSNTRGKIGGHLLRPSLRNLKQDISHTDRGGAILLGLNGIVIKCHGRADAETVTNGIKGAVQALDGKVLERIATLLSPNEVEV